MTPALTQSLEPGVVALGQTLIDFLWQGALIALAYAIARALLSHSRARLFAGHVALLALAIAPLLSLSAHLSATPVAASVEVGGVQLQNAIDGVMQADATSLLSFWPYWLVTAWAAGVVLLSLRLWNQWRRLQHVCRDSVPLDADWQSRFEQLKRRLSVRVRVRLQYGARVAAPMLVGVLRPTILLPASLMARLPADQLELILLHELAHLRRFDPLLNLFQTVIVTLLFYHPAVHWVSRKVREDRELCCDEDVVACGGDRLRYARVLLTLAEHQWPAVPTPALAASGGVLLQRVEHIVELPSPRAAHTQGVTLLGLATMLALVWWLPQQAQDDDRAYLSGIHFPGSALMPSAMMIAPIMELMVADVPVAPRVVLAPVWTADDADTSHAPPTDTPEAISQVVVVPTALDPLLPTRMELAPVVAAVTAPELAAPAGATAHSPPAEIIAVDEPLPRRRVEPVYPAAARLRGEQGWALLSYRVDALGRVGEVAVEQAEPAGVFDQAALEALQRWRFDPGDASGRSLRVRFDFVLAERAQSANPALRIDADRNGRCKPRTGTRLCHTLRDGTVELSRD